MRKTFLTIFLGIILSCQGDSKLKNKASEPKDKSFNLSGKLSNFYTDKVYLNKLKDNSYFPIDSSSIDKNMFLFKGKVAHPERFALTFKNYTTEVIIVIENCDFNIEINQLQLNDPIITGSNLNMQLNEYQTSAKKIFSKIDYLFPEFQNARLENNVLKLKEIRAEMNKIETEFTQFSFDFIENNKNSYISAMILRDLLKTPNIDSLKVDKLYKEFPEYIKQSSDSKIIANYLNLP
jgi:hypothetical protein